MKQIVILGFCFAAGVELLVFLLYERRLVLAMSGCALTVLLLAVRRLLSATAGPAPASAESGDVGDSLQSWLSGTQTLIRRSESTRREWDRHLRPILARRFEMTTRQRRTRNPAQFNATGRMLFGADLWAWVDPTNVTRTGGTDPGPGRAALEAILQRLEQA